MTTMTLDAAKAQSDYRHESARRYRSDQRGSANAGTATAGPRARTGRGHLLGWLHHS